MTTLTCACCTAPLLPEQAAPAPEDAELFYHRDFNDCLAYTVARLALGRDVPPAMAAVVGWTGEDDDCGR